MHDHLTPEQRHRNMSAIRAKDTKPELIVRHHLWSHGFRYRLNHYRLPGKPDIVLKKYNTCIFINDHKIVKYQISEEESDYSIAAEDEQN